MSTPLEQMLFEDLMKRTHRLIDDTATIGCGLCLLALREGRTEAQVAERQTLMPAAQARLAIALYRRKRALEKELGSAERATQPLIDEGWLNTAAEHIFDQLGV